VLDFGGGNGNNRFFFQGFQLIGFDIDKSRIRQIRDGSNYFVTDGMLVGLKNECVDFIFCNWVLEYIPSPDAAVREIFRLLRPGGRVYLGVPTKLCRIVNEGAALPWRFIGGPKNIMLPDGGEEVFFSATELERMLRVTNFRNIEIHQTAGVCLGLLKLFLYYAYYARVLMVKVFVEIPSKLYGKLARNRNVEEKGKRASQCLKRGPFPKIDTSKMSSSNDFEEYLAQLRRQDPGLFWKAYVLLMRLLNKVDERFPRFAFEIAVIATKD
jgi:SAM-dependent methyltransferase